MNNATELVSVEDGIEIEELGQEAAAFTVRPTDWATED